MLPRFVAAVEGSAAWPPSLSTPRSAKLISRAIARPTLGEAP